MRATVWAWRVDDQRVTSTDLVHVLRTARGRVTVHVGSSVQSNMRTVRRGYGESRVRVRYANGGSEVVRAHVLTSASFVAQAARGALVVRMRVLEVVERSRWRDEVRDNLLKSLARTRTGGRVLLKLMAFRDMEIMWNNVKLLKLAHEREHARGRLAKHALRVWGVSLRARPIARVPMSVVFPRAAMVHAVRALFHELGDTVRPAVRRLAQRVRFVRAKPTTVSGELCRGAGGWQQWSKKEYVPGCEPACS